ncbi:hypothetical protein F4776DRAFT_595112 [Hypoxylon sp. NC0597]|nr:hypothetical protein F4776DRAFT_595112 [Hypoxylon sp. NC0597]
MAAPPQPQIANWGGAPYPFASCIAVPRTPGDYRVNLGTPAMGNRIVGNLEKICQWGGGNKITTASLLNESEIWLLMSAFNFNQPNSFSKPWTWVSQHMLDIPNMNKLPRRFRWATWEQPARINTFQNNENLANELGVPWVSVKNKRQRTPNFDPMYRFFVFMHRHQYPNDRSTSKSLDRVYSMTVFDRENETAVWYDFWPHGDRELRWSNIQSYWANIPFNWPAPLGGNRMSTTLERIEYNSVEITESESFQRLPPAYTQFMMMNAILHFMNQPNKQAGSRRNPIPQTIADVTPRLSGVHGDYTPKLIFVLFQCIRLSKHARPDLGNNDRPTRERIEGLFKVDARATGELLSMMYLEPTYADTNERWIIRALTDDTHIGHE